MVDPDSKPYEVGKYKPPKEHQFKPGNVPTAHRPKGAVGITKLIREKLGEEIPGQGRTIAEAVATKVVAELLRNPSKYWPLLKTLMEREEPLLLAEEQAAQLEEPEDSKERQERLSVFLGALEDSRRREVCRILLDVEKVQRGEFRPEDWLRATGKAMPPSEEPR